MTTVDRDTHDTDNRCAEKIGYKLRLTLQVDPTTRDAIARTARNMGIDLDYSQRWRAGLFRFVGYVAGRRTSYVVNDTGEVVRRIY